MSVDPSTPLKLADGSLVYPDGRVVKPGRQVSRLVEVPTHSDAQKLVVGTRRKLSDLPVPPQQLNMLSVVTTYKLIGLSDEEITIATGLSKEQVGRIIVSDAYISFRDTVLRSIEESDVASVRSIISRHATNAINTIAYLVTSDDDTVALHASKDILDRAGHRPVDVVEHRHRMEGGLRIEYVDATKQLPTIELSGDEL